MDSSFKIQYVMVAMFFTILIVNISDIVIITTKNVHYRCIIHNISKSEAINLLENSVLENCGYIYIKYSLKFQSTQDSIFTFFV